MSNAPCAPLRSRISRASALRAVESLLKWIRAQNSKNITATRHEDSIYLILTLTKTPHKLQSKPYRIPLPHSPHHPSAVSLILDDRPNSLPTLSAARELVRSLPISQILSFSDLRSGTLPSGELQIADRRIARLLRGFKRKEKSCKIVEVDFREKVWLEYVRLLCFSTVLNLGSGTCSGIRVGRASQGRDVILESLMAAVDGAVRNVPRKWSNVKSFHIKTSESLALPIYEKSSWSGKKVDDDDIEDNDDSEEEEEERMEDEKHRKIERTAERVAGKRARNGSVLDLERSKGSKVKS